MFFLYTLRSLFHILAHGYSQYPANVSLLESYIWAVEHILPAWKERQTCLGLYIPPATALNQWLMRWGINIFFFFTLIGTTFRSDLHCFENSAQDWGIVNPCHTYSTRLCLMFRSCLAYSPSWSHFLTLLRFLLGTLLLIFTPIFVSEFVSKLVSHNSKTFSTS